MCKYINTNTQIREYNFFLQSIQKYSKYFWNGNGTRTSNTKFRFVWHANTNTQKHKYTNTALVKVTDMPNICYIFRKEMVRGHQKQCSQLSDMQIQIHKNTNTHIHKYTNTDSVKVPNRPNMAYIFEKVMVHTVH